MAYLGQLLPDKALQSQALTNQITIIAYEIKDGKIYNIKTRKPGTENDGIFAITCISKKPFTMTLASQWSKDTDGGLGIDLPEFVTTFSKKKGYNPKALGGLATQQRYDGMQDFTTTLEFTSYSDNDQYLGVLNGLTPPAEVMEYLTRTMVPLNSAAGLSATFHTLVSAVDAMADVAGAMLSGVTALAFNNPEGKTDKEKKAEGYSRSPPFLDYGAM